MDAADARPSRAQSGDLVQVQWRDEPDDFGADFATLVIAP